jgi:GNAT superfamily N-acetyltransferase
MIHYREATVDDIPGQHVVRMAVTENVLPSADLISPADYEDYLVRRGKGWVAEENEKIVGLAIVDLIDHNVWALFVMPGYEKMGIGFTLHRMMMDWYFVQTDATIWLGTSPRTRAENFYRKAGWIETGRRKNGEVRFEMTAERWIEKYG